MGDAGEGVGGVVHRARASVELGVARTKWVTVPVDGAPVAMGMRDEVAAHYRVEEGTYEPHATTLDFLVGATAACLVGTLGGALTARAVPVLDGRLQAEAFGELEVDGGTLVLRRIEVRYRLRVDPGADRAAIERAHEHHPRSCPVARSLAGSIEISTTLEVVEEERP